MEPVFAPIVMYPPVAPSAGVFAERGTGDGLQRGADQILRGGLEGIIVEEIQELGNGGEALLIREHAGTRKVGGSAFANLLGGIVGQNGKKRVDGVRSPQPCQFFASPETYLVICFAIKAKEAG